MNPTDRLYEGRARDGFNPPSAAARRLWSALERNGNLESAMLRQVLFELQRAPYQVDDSVKRVGEVVIPQYPDQGAVFRAALLMGARRIRFVDPEFARRGAGGVVSEGIHQALGVAEGQPLVFDYGHGPENLEVGYTARHYRHLPSQRYEIAVSTPPWAVIDSNSDEDDSQLLNNEVAREMIGGAIVVTNRHGIEMNIPDGFSRMSAEEAPYTIARKSR